MIILDEKDYAELILKKGIQTASNKFYDLQLLAAYLEQAGCSDTEMEQRLHATCKRRIKGYSRVKFYSVIDGLIKRAKTFTFKESQPIKITKAELDVVLSEDSVKIRRLLFVYLVLAKYYMNNNHTDKYYVGASDVDIFKLARINSVKVETRNEFMHEITKKGYITPTLSMSSIVNYVNEDSEVVMEFKPDIDMEYHLEQYLGGSFLTCTICGRLDKKGSNSAKYCRQCAKEIRTGKILMRDKI